jgi:hypothetical protein
LNGKNSNEIVGWPVACLSAWMSRMYRMRDSLEKTAVP